MSTSGGPTGESVQAQRGSASSMLAGRIDTFVRWFFNSSPDTDLILPTSQSARHVRALSGAGLVGAVLLLAIFYSVVAGAVERGASRRADLATHASVAAATATAPSVEIARLGN